jgi:hypothetical protein
MRFVLGLLLGLGFLGGGLYAFAGMVSMMLQSVDGEEVLAAGFIGTMLAFIGAAIIWGAFRSRQVEAKADLADVGRMVQASIVATNSQQRAPGDE